MHRLIVCSIFMLAFSMTVVAQEHHVRMVFKDGRVLLWPVSEVDYIDFPKSEDVVENYLLSLSNNMLVWDNNSHSAFTCLTDYQGHKLLAFREGASHRPAGIADYGHITVLQETDSQWKKISDLTHPDMDLRDPFFVKIAGGLRMYCGYNQFVNEKYQHSGTAYSDLTETGWTDFKTIKHDVPHITWLWKIRKYRDRLYGVGYLEGEKPVLLSSQDGDEWYTVTTFQLEGVLTEADICFLNDSMYVCLRQDTPWGTPSHWGVAKYPFEDFQWTTMNISLHCPDMLCLPETNQIFLAGRQLSSEAISVSVFECDKLGQANKIVELQSNPSGDMGYPSFFRTGSDVYLSYYYGSGVTAVSLACFNLGSNE